MFYGLMNIYLGFPPTGHYLLISSSPANVNTFKSMLTFLIIRPVYSFAVEFLYRLSNQTLTPDSVMKRTLHMFALTAVVNSSFKQKACNPAGETQSKVTS